MAFKITYISISTFTSVCPSVGIDVWHHVWTLPHSWILSSPSIIISLNYDFLFFYLYTEINKRRLSFGGMIGQTIDTNTQQDDIEALANSILGNDEDNSEKSESLKSESRSKNKRRLSFKRSKKSDSDSPDK